MLEEGKVGSSCPCSTQSTFVIGWRVKRHSELVQQSHRRVTEEAVICGCVFLLLLLSWALAHRAPLWFSVNQLTVMKCHEVNLSLFSLSLLLSPLSLTLFLYSLSLYSLSLWILSLYTLSLSLYTFSLLHSIHPLSPTPSMSLSYWFSSASHADSKWKMYRMEFRLEKTNL